MISLFKKYIPPQLRYIVVLTVLTLIPFHSEAALIYKSPPSNGLIGWWTLDGADVTDKVYDRSGRGNNGYFFNGATSTAKTMGNIGRAMKFDGVDDYVSLQNSIASAAAGTMSAWIRPSGDYTSTQFVMGGAAPTGFGPTVRFLIEARNTGLCGSGDWLTLITNDPSSSQIVCSGQIYNAANFPAGVWTLLTITHDGSNVKFYKDGVLVNTVVQTASGVGGAQPFSIGRAGAFDGSYFSGSIDDVRIYNRALSGAEIQQLYNSQQSVPKMNTSQNSRSANGLVGLWSFDGPDMAGVTAYDRSGQGNNGTLTNGPFRTIGKIGQALAFDGTNDYVVGTNVVNIQKTAISTWVFLPQYPASNSKIVGFSDGLGSTVHDKTIFIDSAGKPFFHVFDGSIKITSTPASPIPLNKWVHLVGTADGTTARMYVDGVQVGSVAAGDTFAGYTVPNVFINGNTTVPAYAFLQDRTDDVRIYNRALSVAEIRHLYNEGGSRANTSQNSRSANGLVGLWSFDGPDMAGVTAYDRSGQGNNGTLTNGPMRILGKLGQALKFNGSSNYVINSAPTGLSSNAPQSVSLWFKINSLTVANRPILAVYGQTSGSLLAQFALGFNQVGIGPSEGTGKLTFIDFNGSSVSGAYTSRDFSSPLDKNWHHAVGMWDGSRWRIFIDGVEDTNAQGTQDAPTTGASMVFSMGANVPDSGANRFFDGSIDDVRIYNRTLSAADVKRLYNMGR